VHNHLIGGGFGRRLEVDGVTRAVQIAQHVDGPVKVVWTREEDIQHDMYRPAFFDRTSAGLDEKGMPVAWNNRFAGSSIIARWLPLGGVRPTYEMQRLAIRAKRLSTIGLTADSHPSGNSRATAAGGVFC
jgi:CO/xanthine dehydrogenase Mo-binding subunit